MKLDGYAKLLKRRAELAEETYKRDLEKMEKTAENFKSWVAEIDTAFLIYDVVDRARLVEKARETYKESWLKYKEAERLFEEYTEYING